MDSDKEAKAQARKERQNQLFLERCKKDIFDKYDANRNFLIILNIRKRCFRER